MVILHTQYGDITLELDSEKAPNTCANFLSYAKDGFFDGTIFHRVIENFMIQGGGFEEDMNKKDSDKDPIENEADNGLTNDRGTVAMARTQDPHSATAQFFINTVDNNFLNHTAKTEQGWGYTVFAKVIDGLDVVDKIRCVATGSQGTHQDVPLEPVLIKKVTVTDDEE